jgi:hypothetical protein
LDWDINGNYVASGGKDRQVKLWTNWNLIFSRFLLLKNLFYAFIFVNFTNRNSLKSNFILIFMRDI